MDDESFGSIFEKVKARLVESYDRSLIMETRVDIRRSELKDTIELLEMVESRLSDWSDHSAMLEMELDKYRGVKMDGNKITAIESSRLNTMTLEQAMNEARRHGAVETGGFGDTNKASIKLSGVSPHYISIVCKKHSTLTMNLVGCVLVAERFRESMGFQL